MLQHNTYSKHSSRNNILAEHTHLQVFPQQNAYNTVSQLSPNLTRKANNFFGCYEADVYVNTVMTLHI